MTERCKNCGAELFAGQQFCRRCGARTLSLEGEAPTQILPGETSPPNFSSAAGTNVLPPQRGTGEAMWGPRQTGPQAPFGQFAHTSPLSSVAQTSKKRRWLLPALLGLLLVGAVGGALAVVMLSRATTKKVIFIDREGHAPHPPSPPGIPTGESLLDEAGATVTADETILTKSFEVGADANFSLKNVQGDIRVEGWDDDRIEVRMRKRGGTVEERQAARVTFKQMDETLAIAATGNSPSKVFFDVKVPRSLKALEVSSRTGAVSVSKLEGSLEVSLQNGDVNLDDVRGAVEAKLVNGRIEVTYRSTEREGAQEFTTVNGDVVVRLVDGMSGDVEASVVNGRIEVDEALGFQAQKRQPGWHVEAQLGAGGESLTAKSVNGTIRFKK